MHCLHHPSTTQFSLITINRSQYHPDQLSLSLSPSLALSQEFHPDDEVLPGSPLVADEHYTFLPEAHAPTESDEKVAKNTVCPFRVNHGEISEAYISRRRTSEHEVESYPKYPDRKVALWHLWPRKLVACRRVPFDRKGLLSLFCETYLNHTTNR